VSRPNYLSFSLTIWIHFPAKQAKHRPLQEKGLRLFTIGPATFSLTLFTRKADRQAATTTLAGARNWNRQALSPPERPPPPAPL
jgi:hypothetical protein